jgi:acetylornithine/succinyldiaminopimelate/putrescine aminotransferase
VTWNARWYGFPRAPFDVRFVPREDLAALDKLLAKGDVAAVIAEPVQGVAGAVALSDEWLAGARAATARHGSLLILDEVQSGMGRCGAPFVAQAAGVTPDLLTVAKGIAGGFPAAALLVSDALAATLKVGDLGTTFGGGPLACALIEATLDAIEQEDLIAAGRTRAERIRDRCRVGPVTGIGGRGLLIGLRTTRSARTIQRELLDRGLLVGTSADANVVRLLPPLVISDADVDLLAAALAELPA